MDSSDMIRLLDTDHYSPADLEEVSDICRNYPMFNLAHVLKVRIMESMGRDKEAELRRAAVYACDRNMLRKMVTELTPSRIQGEEPEAEEPGGIQFSDEPHQEVDVIIEQHAPYATAYKGADLLELDEEDNTFELSSETLIQTMVKDETDMEEPDPHGADTPVIDELEHGPEEPLSHRLIRNFIHQDPGPIRAGAPTSIRGDASLASIREHDGFITDTLAQIYVKQGLHAKAIYAYEKLSLKYPEKSAYFAAQIEKIKNIKRS